MKKLISGIALCVLVAGTPVVAISEVFAQGSPATGIPADSNVNRTSASPSAAPIEVQPATPSDVLPTGPDVVTKDIAPWINSGNVTNWVLGTVLLSIISLVVSVIALVKSKK